LSEVGENAGQRDVSRQDRRRMAGPKPDNPPLLRRETDLESHSGLKEIVLLYETG
jgi:hypothetical protein